MASSAFAAPASTGRIAGARSGAAVVIAAAGPLAIAVLRPSGWRRTRTIVVLLDVAGPIRRTRSRFGKNEPR